MKFPHPMSSRVENIPSSTAGDTSQHTRCPVATMLCRRLGLSLFFLCAVALLAQPCAATPGQWEYTGSLNTARFHQTAALLPDGRVLVAGGEDGRDALASAELYDPAT